MSESHQPADDQTTTPASGRIPYDPAAVLNALPGQIAILDQTGRIIATNAAWRRFAGSGALAGAGFGVGADYAQLCEELDSQLAPVVARGTRALLAGEGPQFELEYLCPSPDGSRWCRLSVAPLEGQWPPAALVTHFDSVGHTPSPAGDSSRQKQVEEALRESKELFRQLAENIPAVFWLTSRADDTLLYVSPAYETIWGRSTESLYADPASYLESLHPDDRARASQVFARRSDDGYDLEYRIIRSTGEIAWIRDHAFPIRGEDGRIDRVAGIATDITERKRAEAAIHESEERFRQLAESLRSVFWLRDVASGSLLYVSPAYETIWGRTCQSLYDDPRSFMDAIHADDLARAQHAFGRQASEAYEIEYRIARPDGSTVWVHDYGVPIRNAAGRLTRVAGIATDVTDRRRLEEQLLQSQKMEGIGRLAGGIAHDFNNLLTAIVGYGELALSSLAPDDLARTDIEQILKAAGRATELTRQLLAFARKQIVEPRVINLNELVLGMDKMLRRLIGEDIDLATLPAPDLGLINVDPGQFEQILINLAVNARDAMPNGGKLTIETRNVVLDQEYTRHYPEMMAGAYVQLSISDTGVGMTPAVRARLFEPFFTTKGPGKGTGLGLATCYGIVKQAGGHIWVYSEPGRGTAFKIYLPRVEGRIAAPARSEAISHTLAGDETLLLVEDEPLVRDMATQVLRAHGYTVLVAGTGAEALALAASNAGAIDLLVTDVVMPQMSGKQLAEQLALERPGIKILYVSGYTENTIVHHGVLDEGVAFLAKPFTPGALARKIRDILDAA